MHKFKELRPYLIHDQVGGIDGAGYFIKKPWNSPVRTPRKQNLAYEVLKNKGLRMPRVRLFGDQENPCLLIQGIHGRTVDTIVEEEPTRAFSASREFLEDMISMWDGTIKPTDETAFRRNLRLENLQMIDTLFSSQLLLECGDKQASVNGVDYPSLKETMTKVRSRLATQESYMVLRHEDEQIENILATKDGYRAIDPSYSGYGYASVAANHFVVTNYALHYHWNEKHRLGKKLEVELSLQRRSKKPEKLFREACRYLEYWLDNTGQENFLKDYLFVNFLRIAAGKIRRPTDISEILAKPFAYVALANISYHQSLYDSPPY